jgi:hypothetical protein
MANEAAIMALSLYLLKFGGFVLGEILVSLLIGFAIRIYRQGKYITIEEFREPLNSYKSNNPSYV